MPSTLNVWSVAYDLESTIVPIAPARWVSMDTSMAPKGAWWAWSDSNATGAYTFCDLTNPACVTSPSLFPPGGAMTFARWRGRPVLAADRLGHVAMVLLYDTDGDAAAEGVAVLLSNDGGETYSSVTDVTNPKAGDDCETGEQDSPHASWDLTTGSAGVSPAISPTLVVSWKHKDKDACIRELAIPPLGGRSHQSPRRERSRISMSITAR